MTPDALTDRVADCCSLLDPETRALAVRVVELRRELQVRPRQGTKLLPEPTDLELRRELGRLVELLSRRAAKAIPVATLGRACLAVLSGDDRSARQAELDCELGLAALGL